MDIDQRTMLALALNAYNGFDLLGLGEHERLLAMIGEGLESLDVGSSQWSLAWGPAHYRLSFSILESSMFYVARDSADPAHLVVAIRGTNPVEAADWLWQDVQVHNAVPWQQSDAQISLSSAMGLALLTGLREPLPGRALARWFDRAAHLFTEVPELIESLWDHEQRLGQLVRTLAAIEGGPTLPEFLRSERDKGLAQHVSVTGHSKGGALAPTFALWLEDNRERWDPAGDAAVRCFGFAGPSAGSTAFVERFEQRVGDRAHMLANDKDAVPLAWRADTLARAPGLYGDVLGRGAIQLLADHFLDEMTSGGVTYDHVPRQLFEGAPLEHALGYLGHMAHHHLDAYVIELDLPDKYRGATLLRPV